MVIDAALSCSEHDCGESRYNKNSFRTTFMKRIFATLLAIAFSIACSAQWKQPEQPAQEPEVPAYHSGPPAKSEKLPPILTPDKLAPENRKLAYQPRSYELAAKVPRVLYQQPCYCFCSKSVGHTSLHSCFESEH